MLAVPQRLDGGLRRHEGCHAADASIRSVGMKWRRGHRSSWRRATSSSKPISTSYDARLRGKMPAKYRQIIVATNPGFADMHWIKVRLIDGGEASVYYSGAKDNPTNPADYHWRRLERI